MRVEFVNISIPVWICEYVVKTIIREKITATTAVKLFVSEGKRVDFKEGIVKTWFA
jgi:hypothetical protein